MDRYIIVEVTEWSTWRDDSLASMLVYNSPEQVIIEANKRAETYQHDNARYEIHKLGDPTFTVQFQPTVAVKGEASNEGSVKESA